MTWGTPGISVVHGEALVVRIIDAVDHDPGLGEGGAGHSHPQGVAHRTTAPVATQKITRPDRSGRAIGRADASGDAFSILLEVQERGRELDAHV